MSKIAATVRTADRVDYWIRRHVISYCDGSYPSQRKVNSARDKRVVRIDDRETEIDDQEKAGSVEWPKTSTARTSQPCPSRRSRT